MTQEESRRNPTMTIEMTAAGITVVGVFREGRIDRGGSVTRVDDPDGRSTRWQGQTARRNDLGIGPVYTGGDEAKCLLATLKELDHELVKSREELTNSRRLSTRPAPPPVFSCRS